MSSLTSRKIKIWTANPGRSTVSVFQDGSAADADATAGFKFDDAFIDGAQDPGTTDRTDRVGIWVSKIENELDNGPTLTLKLQSPRQWFYNQYPAVAINPNDKVEFYSWAPGANPAVRTPAWHLNNQPPGQVRVFLGWVEQIDSAGGVVTAVARSALWKSNDVKLMRDGPGGLSIPKIAFNVERNSPEWFFAVKKITPATSPSPHPVFGTGSPQLLGDSRMTLREILEYLQTSYATQLQALGVIPAGTVFDASELAGLTQKPGPIVLEDMGFFEGVRQILSAWAPDMRIAVDARSQLWHLVRSYASFKDTSTTLTSFSERVFWDGAFRTRVPVVNGALFSSVFGTDGFFARLMDASDPQRTDLVTVHTVAGNAVTFHEDVGPNAIYDMPDKLLPMQGEILPTVPVSFDTFVDPKSLSMAADLRDVFSAVRITAIHTKTTQHRVSWSPTQANAGGMSPAWNRDFEAFWKEADVNREMDKGANGDGMAVYKIVDAGGAVSDVYIAFTESAFNADHVADEWNGCALNWLTAANTNIRSLGSSALIGDFTISANMGDGRTGMIVRIATSAIPAGFLTEITAIAPAVADKVGLTQSADLSTPTGLNERFKVGTHWEFSVQTLHSEGGVPHAATCSAPQFTTHDGSGNPRQELGLSPSGPYPAQNNTATQQWQAVGTGGAGSHLIFRRIWRTHRAATGRGAASAAGCGGSGGWQPPKMIEATWEVTTQELRQARYPSSGYAGMSFNYYGLQREKHYKAEHWLNDDQQSTYDDLAYRLWNAHQRVNYRGQVTCLGANEFLAAIDMGVRVGFTTSMFPVGGGGILTSFWGIVAGVIVDLENDRVEFTFDADSTLKKLALEVFEDLSVRQKAKIDENVALAQHLAQIVQCMMGNRPSATSPFQCDSQIAAGPRNARAKGGVPAKDNWGHGLGISAASVPASGGGGGSTTHGANATQTVFQDLGGRAYLITAGEGIMGGSVASGVFTSTPGSTPPPTTVGSQAQGGANAALAALGLTQVVPAHPTFSDIVTAAVNGSGNTVFTLTHTGMATNAYAGGNINVLDFDEDNVRGPYVILSNTGSTITVAGAKPIPREGTPANVFALAPSVNASEFPNGGVVATDANGDYVVVDSAAGTVSAASYDSVTRVASKVTGGPVALRVGPDAGNGAVINFGGSLPQRGAIGAGFDGGGSEIVDNSVVQVIVPYAFTLHSLRAVADRAGDFLLDIRSQPFDGYSETGWVPIGSQVWVDGEVKYEDESLSGYVTSFGAGTVLRFEVSNVLAVQSLEVSLEVQRRNA